MSLKHGTLHAEVDALLKLPIQKKTKTIILAVYRTNKHGDKLTSSKCCKNCEKSIEIICKRKNYQIKDIYYINHINQLVKY